MDQLTHRGAVEDQARAGGFEQLRQRFRRTKRERLAVLANGLSAVPKAVAPDLQGAELSDPVLDVVKGAGKKMRLLVPARDAFRIEAIPLHKSPFESSAKLEPLAVARSCVAPLLVNVDPLLERIDRRAVR